MLATDAKRDQELQLPNIRKVFNKLIGFELKVRGFRIENCLLLFCGCSFFTSLEQRVWCYYSHTPFL